MAETRPRPVPKPTPTTQAFWDGARRGELMLQYDPVEDRYQFWPRASSVRTGKRNLEWRATSGTGQLYSYTVTHVPTAGFEGQTPYILGLIELDEGVRIIANLKNVGEDQIKIGMRVRVTWEDIGKDTPYFAFEPDDASETSAPGDGSA